MVLCWEARDRFLLHAKPAFPTSMWVMVTSSILTEGTKTPGKVESQGKAPVCTYTGKG